MDQEKIMLKLQQIFRETFQDETMILSEEMNPNNVKKWDSLMHVSLLLKVCEVFHIESSFEELQSIRDVRDILYFIQKQEH